ncbi:hypothetical protein ACQKNS_24425 [Peribacillus sp. NPDC094092]|uniref:hypothetical protein n=1 Tax=Peribacillus sp. NPDC094092 TaxID=3390611 RepID=UPI003CFE1498
MRIEDDIELCVVKKKLDEFSVQRKQFVKDVEHNDILMVILKTHLYIEKEMIELTEEFFKFPKKLSEYKFKARLNLLYSLGIIEKQLYEPISSINDIRNKFAHNLTYEFTKKDYKRIKDTLSKETLTEFKKDKDFYSTFNKDMTYIDEAKILLTNIWVSLKSDVLMSFKHKQMLASEYYEHYYDEIKKYNCEVDSSKTI